MNSKKILLGVLAGIAAGALLGVLFAPEKGSDLREKASKKGAVLSDSLKGKLNKFLDSFSERIAKGKEELSDFAEPAKAKTGKTKKEVKTSTD